MNRFVKTLFIATLLIIIPIKSFSQQPKPIKLSEISVSHIRTIEERVFLIHSIIDKGYICQKNPNKSGIIDIYVPNDASDELSDFDFFYDNLLYDNLNTFSNLDKTLRGELFVQWRYGIDDEVFHVLYEDFTRGIASENATCETALPFCTDVGLYQFPAGTNSGSPCGNTYNASCSAPYACSNTPGQSTNCLSTAPNPAFYYLRIDEPGNLDIYMYSTPLVDIDFDCWGPFQDINTACEQLSCSNIVDCSYRPDPTENCHINRAQSGEYYILLITNYSNDPCNISFENVGSGSTDCSIMPPLVSGGGPYCVGETIHLTAQNQPGASFKWRGPNGFTSLEQNTDIENCTLDMAGVYTCTIIIGGETSSAETDYIEINPQPTADFLNEAACEGHPMTFHNISTTEPAGQQITSYRWAFGDGQTSSDQNPTHTYAQAGEYQVTLAVATGGGRCTSTITKNVTVQHIPAPTAIARPSSVIYNGTSTLTSSSDTPGTFSYHWEPANMVDNPNAQSVQTVPLVESQTYTVTVTNLEGGCSSTTQVTVNMAGSNLTAQASVDDNEICENTSTTLHALPSAGTGHYTYRWSPANTLSNSTSQNPVASPPVGTTTYTCIVGDGITEQEVSVSVKVHPNTASDMFKTICENGSYNFFGQEVHTPGVYRHTIESHHGCDSVISLHLSNYPTEASDMYDAICEGDTYSFYGQTLYSPGTYNHTLETQHGCDSIITLHLGLNPNETTDFATEDGLCDSYFWDPKGHTIISSDHEGMEYTQSGIYHRTYENIHGCDSTVTMSLHLDYTPNPTEIYPMDPDNTAPHWVVTATEFQINTYDFYLWDQNPNCAWDTVTWSYEGASQWVIEPFGSKAKCCKLYVLDKVEDTVWLKAHAFNHCAPEQGIEQKYWFVCSFYGLEENDPSAGSRTVDFNVVPNPNNGQMTLNFENLSGKINVKVYDMKGALIDGFDTYNGNGPSSYSYEMKDKSSGIYFFVATGKEGTAAKKVVIQQ